MSKNIVYIAMGLALSTAAAMMDAALKTDKRHDSAVNQEFQSCVSVTPNPKLFFRPGAGISARSIY